MLFAAASADADDGLLPFVEGPAPPARSGAEPWRVLVVDDDDDVHVATEIAMRDVIVEGRTIAFLHARSAEEAFGVIARDAGIAVALLDVVMETPDAGLRLVRRVRLELQRDALRIILRTGQPGYAPEIETLREYDINDYRTKSELTRARLFSSLTTAIRAYAQLTELAAQRDALQALNAELAAARAAERAELERRLETERQLREARDGVEQCVALRTEELSQAVAELETFNRMVSHDLSGPLHGLASMAGILKDEVERGEFAKLERWLPMMEAQTQRLAELVNELLALSRAGRTPLQRASTDLDAIAAEAVQALALAGRNVGPLHVGPLPRLDVDAVLLRQVFVNLIGNAIKFTQGNPAPRVEVSARRDAGAGAGGWIFTVRDNGVGFDPDRADDLFKPFARLHEARYVGSGIGLTIVKRIVERHDGRAWAEAPEGGGAAFHFTLPDTGR